MKADSRHVVLVEPYFGGSHKAFVEVLLRHSRHRFTLVTLPARKWKWRMRGAAMWFARNETGWMDGGANGAPDAILCSDMMSVADFRALLPPFLRSVPLACYFHENQLTYPLSPRDTRDYQYGMTNITSCLAADAVWFNSAFHRGDFLGAADELLAKMPDFVPRKVINEIRLKSAVLPPPVDVSSHAGRDLYGGTTSSRKIPRILWCHRWEYDKNPEPFFDALIRLDEAGVPFELAITGEGFRTAPPVFDEARKRLGPRIVHDGYISSSRHDYLSAISSCDIVVSTAIQENFGIAVVEAVLCGCHPLLPNRLAYPELIPADLHAKCLYESDADLLPALRACLRGELALDEANRELLRGSLIGRCGVPRAVEAIDNALSGLITS